MAPVDPRDHWPRHARQWALVGPPLRPGPDDVAATERAVAAWSAGEGRAPRALVLGVTPELVTMAWPAGARVLAVDRSAAVIDAILPRGAAPAIQADWCALPLGDASIDVVIGDGSPSNLRFPAQYHALAAELARVLDRGGRAIVRLFAAPADAEPLDAVAAALAAGRIGSFHALKWRVAMAIQPRDRNVAVADLGRAIEALVGDRAALAARTGWPRAVIDAVDAYRGSAVTYSFPTLDEVAAAFEPHLGVVGVARGGYELAERCPLVTWCRAVDGLATLG